MYNSEGTLRELVARLERTLSGLSVPFEVLFVNDGSKDHSWDVICELAKEHDWVHRIDLMRNYGQHNALLCGIRAATHEIIVTMDDDLQHLPEEIPKLLDKLTEGYDVVYGTPQEQVHGLGRNLASRLIKMALRSAMGDETARDITSFRAFRTQLRDAFNNYHSPYVSIDVLLSWATTRFAAARVRHQPRLAGASNYGFRQLVSVALNLMTGFTALPLRIATLMGFAFTSLGLIALAYVLLTYLIHGTTVPGFTFLASAILVFSGAQLLVLGLIGEYLARVHFRTMDKPPYVIRLSPKGQTLAKMQEQSGLQAPDKP